jgi:hypothetical protein
MLRRIGTMPVKANSRHTKEEKAMRGLYLVLCCGIYALVSIVAAQPAVAQDSASASKGNCRMEQQCHWKDFKKFCVWVKVCR